MGESAAQTVREIEATRGRLEEDLRELEQRLPAPARVAKKVAGIAVGGGVSGALFWFGVKRIRKRREQKAAAKRAEQVVLKVVPDQWAEAVTRAVEDGQWKGIAAAAGAVWLVMRLAELRQLRRMNRMAWAMPRTATQIP